jgi:hypothetical protein
VSIGINASKNGFKIITNFILAETQQAMCTPSQGYRTWI